MQRGVMMVGFCAPDEFYCYLLKHQFGIISLDLLIFEKNYASFATITLN